MAGRHDRQVEPQIGTECSAGSQRRKPKSCDRNTGTSAAFRTIWFTRMFVEDRETRDRSVRHMPSTGNSQALLAEMPGETGGGDERKVRCP
jgi:hypothetical protein